jgi:hypothetical protein
VSKWGDISAGLTLRQHKHVLMASRDKGAQQKSGHKAGFYQPDIWLKNTPKIKTKCWKNEIKYN